WQSQVYGSLAGEVMKAGVLAAVAMRYDVYVESAATYMAELYRCLARGSSLSAASTRARKLLYETPALMAGGGRGLEDWPVAVCYERRPVIFTKAAETSGTPAGSGPLPAGALALYCRARSQDRAFDYGNLVNLVGMRGSGKTAIAA